MFQEMCMQHPRTLIKTCLPPFKTTDAVAECCINGGCSSVVRESEFKSEDPGFDSLVGQGEKHFFSPSESTLVKTICA